jgi:hypothetical protein
LQECGFQTDFGKKNYYLSASDFSGLKSKVFDVFSLVFKQQILNNQ